MVVRWMVSDRFKLFCVLAVMLTYIVLNLMVNDSRSIRRARIEEAVRPADVGQLQMQTDDQVAKQLQEKVRVLCWVMTGPANHQKRAQHVKNTWGKRCNTLLFMSSEEDSSLPTVALPVGEGRDQLWAKTREAFRYIWANYRHQADWFMKTDDDTYVVLENLRYLLSTYNTSQPIWFGHRFKPYVKAGYLSGGAGYVLSKESLRRLAQQGLTDESKCSSQPGGDEDVEMGKCLESLNVTAVDTRDSFGRGRFFPFSVEKNVVPGYITEKLW